MTLPMYCLIGLAVVIGLAQAGCGVSYKLASFGKVYPIQCAAELSIFGMLMFGIRAGAEWHTLNWLVILSGAVFGITQYLAIRLLRFALTKGPLSPAWCAISLCFVPVILYSAIFLSEHLSLCQYFSILATAGAIVSASLCTKGGTKINSWKNRIQYGILLILLLIFACVIQVGLKILSVYTLSGQSKTVIAASGNLVMFFSYLFMGGSAALDLTLSKSWQWNRFAVYSGGLLTISSLIAFFLTIYLITAPAVIVFALSNAAAILFASIFSVLFFKEKRSFVWGMTIVFSVLAILLNR